MSRDAIGERELVAAVLWRAIEDARGGSFIGPTRYRLAERAREQEGALTWLLSDEVYPYSFSWCCQVLTMCPNAIREKVIDGSIPVSRPLRKGWSRTA